MFEREAVSYTIKTVKEDFDWKDIDKAKIDKYTWCYEYTPETFAQIVLVEDKEFAVKMTCYEKNPKATYKNFGEDVWKDSCMEFFAAFDNKDPNKYVNCEMNSGGAALMSFGYPGADRSSAVNITGRIPQYKAEVFEDYWTVEIRLLLEDIRKIFGDIEFKKGYKFTGNLFKCGDETEYEHYGMWCRSIAVIPQFHQPEYFGDFIIG